MFASIVISIVVTLLICLLFFLFWRRSVRRELRTDAVTGKFRREIDALIADMNGTTERNVALIEDSLQKAQLLIEQAERAAMNLRQETEKRDLSRDVYSSLARSQAAETVVDWKGSGRSREYQREIDAAVPGTAQASAENKPDNAETASETFANMSNKDKVLVQYRRGESSDTIASALGLSRGEVELIISLHDRRR